MEEPSRTVRKGREIIRLSLGNEATSVPKEEGTDDDLITCEELSVK